MDEFDELRKALEPEPPVQPAPPLPSPRADVPLPPGHPIPWKFLSLAVATGCFVVGVLGVIGSLSDRHPEGQESKPEPSTVRQEKQVPATETLSVVKTNRAPSEPTMGKWASWLTSSEFDSSSGATATIKAENEIYGWLNQTERPLLVLRCEEGKTELYLITGMTAEPEYGNYGGTTLRIRLDDGKAFKRNARQSTDRKAYFISSPVGLAKQMEKSSRILIGFVPFNSRPQSIYFHARGAGEAFKLVRQKCKW